MVGVHISMASGSDMLLERLLITEEGSELCSLDLICILQAFIDSTPPSMVIGRSSASFPRTVPWNLDSSPVLLCFFFKAAENRIRKFGIFRKRRHKKKRETYHLDNLLFLVSLHQQPLPHRQ